MSLHCHALITKHNRRHTQCMQIVKDVLETSTTSMALVKLLFEKTLFLIILTARVPGKQQGRRVHILQRRNS